MRKNPNLVKFSTYDPTKESRQVSIKDLCDDIEKEKIVLPIFQTFIRWNIQKAVELFNFQLFGKAAISPISINLIENVNIAVNQVTFVDRMPIDKSRLYGKMSVNDGQQRLTCNYKAYIGHEDFKHVYLDIPKGQFLVNKDDRRTGQIPVGIIYNHDEEVFKKYCEGKTEFHGFDIQGLLTNVRKKFFSYYYIVNIAKDLSGKEQQKWFDVLNRAGSRVTDVEMDLVDLLGKEIDFYSEYTLPFYQKLKDAGLDELFVQKSTEVTIPVACLNPAYEVFYKKAHMSNFCPYASDRKPKLIAKIKSEDDIRSLFETTLKAIDETVEFIERQSTELKTPNNIYQITYLTGFFVYNQGNTISTAKKEKLIEWYNNVNFSVKGDNSKARKIFTDLISIPD
jgi:hypothetical protein